VKKILATCVLELAIAGFTMAQNAASQRGLGVLDRTADQGIAIDSSPREALLEFLRTYNLVGGFAEQRECTPEPKVHLALAKGTKLSAALQSLAAAASEFDWHIEGQVVTVTRRHSHPNLLNVKIGRFEFNRTVAPPEVFRQLMALPEIEAAKENLRLSPGPVTFGPGSTSAAGHRPGIISRRKKYVIQNVSLQDALNEIVRSYGDIAWIYEQRRCNGKETVALNPVQLR
jgi:hypothetical protein